jgi:hypothetical protein
MVKLALWIAVAMACARPIRGPTPESHTALLRLRIDASIASLRGDHAACGASLARAAVLDPRSTEDPYNAAACHARAGQIDEALRALGHAIERGYHDLELLRADPELARLRADPRWVDAERRVQANLDAHLTTVNVALYRIVIEDQRVRMGDLTKVDLQDFVARDAERLARVKAIVEAGGARTADDCFNAALVAQHGETPADYALARRLALQAAALDPDRLGARWLAAAATDRELVSLGKPQRFGTQFTSGSDGILHMNPVDPGVTDAERTRWGVPSLADQQRRIDAMNAAAR